MLDTQGTRDMRAKIFVMDNFTVSKAICYIAIGTNDNNNQNINFKLKTRSQSRWIKMMMIGIGYIYYFSYSRLFICLMSRSIIISIISSSIHFRLFQNCVHSIAHLATFIIMHVHHLQTIHVSNLNEISDWNQIPRTL